MKNLLIIFILMKASVLIYPAYSQIKKGHSATITKEQREAVVKLSKELNKNIKVIWNESNGTPLLIKSNLSKPIIMTKSEEFVHEALDFLEHNKNLFKLNDPSSELSMISNKADNIGMRHIKFNQKNNDIPVWGAQIIVHFSKDNSIRSFNGKYYPSFKLTTIPKLSCEQAVNIAKQFLKDKYNETMNMKINSNTPIFYPKDQQMILSWKLNFSYKSYPNYLLIIDSSTGEILYKNDGVRY